MEADLAFAQAIMDAINGFNKLERYVMKAAIATDPRLHYILLLYAMLYTDRVGKLWNCDEDGNKARDRISIISIKPIRYLYHFNRYNRLSILK